uniref:Mitochondrial carrier protein n=1 Tax=Palpitomonas bilix TaxID=652834 RepID=A0A7S3G3R1_9EUKA|mmetsp:Transcript_19558/g.50118  ORF Transcript_19558/g.50118 Transcript_19558/m.50118 type:complete len:400 (+) Transcript_19558:134-1333(+)
MGWGEVDIEQLDRMVETERCRSRVIRRQVQASTTSTADATEGEPLFTVSELVSGCISGLIADSVLHPIDTIRTRLQVQQELVELAPEVVPLKMEGEKGCCRGVSFTSSTPHSSSPHLPREGVYRGMNDAAVGIVRSEGFLALFQGISATLLLSGPANALYFWSYEIAKRSVHRVEAQFGMRSPEWASAIIAGALADTSGNIIWVPLDVIKQRMQVEKRPYRSHYLSAFSREEYATLKHIVEKEGIRGLYVGFGSSVLTYAPFSAIYFAFYELFKDQACAIGGRSEEIKSLLFDGRTPSPHTYPFSLSLATAFVSGAIAATLTCPFDVVKTRIQVSGSGEGEMKFNYSSSFKGLAQIMREEGVRGLFRGVGARALFFAPSCALTMALYEEIKQNIDGVEE